jgi:hypothetical protein
MSLSATYSDLAPRERTETRAILLVVWAATVIASMVGRGLGQDLSTDDAMRLVEVRDFLAGQGWFDLTQYRLSPPDGVATHWSRLIDVPLAALIRAGEILAPSALAERVAVIIWPAGLLLLYLAGVARLAHVLAGMVPDGANRDEYEDTFVANLKDVAPVARAKGVALLLEPDGAKLSKTRNATPIDPAAAPKLLTSTLTYLSQTPPPDLADASIKDVWNWAVAHWQPQALAGRADSRTRGDSTRQQGEVQDADADRFAQLHRRAGSRHHDRPLQDAPEARGV